MNPSQLKRIAIGLAVVVFFWGMAEILGGGSDDTEMAFVLPALRAADVDLVTIVRSSDTAVLARSGDDWTVNGHKASLGAVEELFEALADSIEAELIAISALSHKRMGVDSAAGKYLLFERDRDTLAAVVFGKRGRAFNSSYVRRAGQDFVYQYTGSLTRLMDRTVDDWRDKHVVSVEPDSVGRVAVQRGGRSYTLVRRGDTWRLDRGAQADSAAVRRMLAQYRSLEANGFATAEQVDSADFEQPDYSVTLVGLQGDTLAALLFDSTSAAFWVRAVSGGTVYRILRWKVNQMVPTDSTLRQ